MCETKYGCEIEDLAQDITLRRIAMGFLTYKRLRQTNAPESFCMQALLDAGITSENTYLLTELESAHTEWEQHTTESNQRRTEQNNRRREMLEKSRRIKG